VRVTVIVVFSLLVATCGQKGPLQPPPADVAPASAAHGSALR
jgi:predicted small lipoprotein YifL